MSVVEPGQDRTIGPEPVSPAHVDVPRETLPEPPPEPDTFPRAYVEELRQEAAKWRTQLREYEGAFEGYDPEEREALVEFLRLSHAAGQGDQAAAAQLQEMLGEDAQEVPEVPDTPMTAEDFRRLAREEAETLVAARDQAREQDNAVTQIINEAKSLGYQTDPGQKGYVDYQRLCYLAIHETPEGTSQDKTLQVAHELLQAEKAAERAAVIDEYLSGKAEATDGSLRLGGPGTAPTTPRIPKTFEEARQFLHDRLERGA